jgi:hypothetical protein
MKWCAALQTKRLCGSRQGGEGAYEAEAAGLVALGDLCEVVAVGVEEEPEVERLVDDGADGAVEQRLVEALRGLVRPEPVLREARLGHGLPHEGVVHDPHLVRPRPQRGEVPDRRLKLRHRQHGRQARRVAGLQDEHHEHPHHHNEPRQVALQVLPCVDHSTGHSIPSSIIMHAKLEESELAERERERLVTVCKDEGRKAEVEEGADLVGWGATELLVAAVLDGPHHEAGEDEESEADEPEVVAERLEEDPGGALAPLVAHRHHHGDPRRHVRQREVHVLRPVRRDGDVRHRRVELLRHDAVQLC